MSQSDAEPNEPSNVLTNCPQCEADLAILRVIPGRGGCEYWALRCTRCGGIHLDIVNAVPATSSASVH